MNNKTLVVLSENELENISGGVNKKALGDAVEYGTAAVSTAVLSVVGSLLALMGQNVLNDNEIFRYFDNILNYVPGYRIASDYCNTLNSIKFYGYQRTSASGDTIKITGKTILSDGAAFAVEAGSGVGGWFAGRAIGKKIRKKLGL